jgi:hypothetical protein
MGQIVYDESGGKADRPAANTMPPRAYITLPVTFPLARILSLLVIHLILQFPFFLYHLENLSTSAQWPKLQKMP